MKTLFGMFATGALSISIPAIAIPTITLGAVVAEAQAYRGHDEIRDAEVRRGLARRAATSQSPEARRYRAQRRAEIRDDRRNDRRHDDYRSSHHDRGCKTVRRDGRRYRVCRD